VHTVRNPPYVRPVPLEAGRAYRRLCSLFFGQTCRWLTGVLSWTNRRLGQHETETDRAGNHSCHAIRRGSSGRLRPTRNGRARSTTSAASSTIIASTTSELPSTTGQPSTTEQPTTTGQPSTTAAPTTTVRSTSTTVRPANDYTRLPTKNKVVALTFDAAYDPAPLKDILAALKEANAEAAFFLTGEFVQDFPRWTERIIAGGYPIGNHSYSHPDFTKLSDAAMRKEIDKTAAMLIKLGAADPKPLFRAPYGALSKRVLSVLRREGYVSVFWTIDTLDWKPERTPAQIKATVLGKLQPGTIILMHVGSKQTARVLPQLLKEIEARGYGFVNLREALPAVAQPGS
jgi:peptidoglycan/xylan/chitin deacetylase (PgdA/CDA1 family)